LTGARHSKPPSGLFEKDKETMCVLSLFCVSYFRVKAKVKKKFVYLPAAIGYLHNEGSVLMPWHKLSSRDRKHVINPFKDLEVGTCCSKMAHVQLMESMA
jgi:hypothetical protein